MSTISIEGLNKAAVFAALYNGARPQGLGFIHYDPAPMTAEEAEKEFGNCDGYYDYVHGRVMKVDLSKNTFDPWLYDRDNGKGSAEQIINALKQNGDTNPIEAMEIHHKGTVDAANVAKEWTDVRSGPRGDGTFELGLAEFAEHLEEPLENTLGEDS
jgi:hypothetical protein